MFLQEFTCGTLTLMFSYYGNPENWSVRSPPIPGSGKWRCRTKDWGFIANVNRLWFCIHIWFCSWTPFHVCKSNFLCASFSWQIFLLWNQNWCYKWRKMKRYYVEEREQLYDCIRNTTAVWNPTQNPVRKKFVSDFVSDWILSRTLSQISTFSCFCDLILIALN